MSAPLVSVVNPNSRVIPPASVLPFHDAVPSPEKRLFWYRGDRGVALQHVRGLVGESAHQRLWPEILEWLEAVEGREDGR